MKKMIAVMLVLAVAGSAFAQVGFQGRPITNNLNAPTGYTLNQGEFAVGIGPIGFGLSDNFQVGTNILLFLFQIYNANVKVNLMESETMAVAAGLEFSTFNLSVDADDVGFTSYSPYAAVSLAMGENTKVHVGGQYSYFSGESEIDDAEVEGSSTGTSVFGGIEHSLSHKTKFLAEAGYDITFEGFRAGGAVLFGWEKFRLKLGVNYFKAGDLSFTLPVIGLWWRFKA